MQCLAAWIEVYLKRIILDVRLDLLRVGQMVGILDVHLFAPKQVRKCALEEIPE
jgi:hypothetical protein